MQRFGGQAGLDQLLLELGGHEGDRQGLVGGRAHGQVESEACPRAIGQQFVNPCPSGGSLGGEGGQCDAMLVHQFGDAAGAVVAQEAVAISTGGRVRFGQCVFDQGLCLGVTQRQALHAGGAAGLRVLMQTLGEAVACLGPAEIVGAAEQEVLKKTGRLGIKPAPITQKKCAMGVTQQQRRNGRTRRVGRLQGQRSAPRRTGRPGLLEVAAKQGREDFAEKIRMWTGGKSLTAGRRVSKRYRPEASRSLSVM